MRVELKPQAIKDLQGLQKQDAARIAVKLNEMKGPLTGDIKRLTNFTPEYRLRVSNRSPSIYWTCRSGGARPPDLADQDSVARSVLAAATMLVSAGMTSSHWRVLRPQSGFTHRRSAGMRSAALRMSATTCSSLGMLGEWMS